MPTHHKARKRILFTKDSQFAVSNSGDGKTVTLTGYAIVWNTLSSDRGGYKVRLLPGSAKFAATCLALYHHDSKLILGNTANGTLRLSSDDIGVKVEIDLPNTQTARDVAELVGKKYVSGMSFGMLMDPEPVSEALQEDGVNILEFSEFTLDEVTVTGIPAFDDTSIDTKKDEPSEEEENPAEETASEQPAKEEEAADDNDEEDAGDYSRRAARRSEQRKLDQLNLDILSI